MDGAFDPCGKIRLYLQHFLPYIIDIDKEGGYPESCRNLYGGVYPVVFFVACAGESGRRQKKIAKRKRTVFGKEMKMVLFYKMRFWERGVLF